MPNFTPQKVSYGSSNDYLFEPTTNQNAGNINAVHVCQFQPLINPSINTESAYSSTAYTVPYDGYYSYSYTISFPSPSATPSNASVAVYARESSSNDIITQNNFNMQSVDANGSCVYSVSGVLKNPLTAGQQIVFYHTDTTGVSYALGTLQMIYTYLGNNTM